MFRYLHNSIIQKRGLRNFASPFDVRLVINLCHSIKLSNVKIIKYPVANDLYLRKSFLRICKRKIIETNAVNTSEMTSAHQIV